ncbi:hypothetical protein TOTORO_01090 [Serratia phage vB_SmaS-Totoro]|nr:hypothetical protein TOTORO_01090 [Serratia phage vB_SmaS-Totoro]
MVRKIWKRRLEIILTLVFVLVVPMATVGAIIFLLNAHGGLQ